MSQIITIGMVLGGVIWAVLGILNIFSLPSWGKQGEESILAVALTINVALFIIPGILLSALGYILDKKMDKKD